MEKNEKNNKNTKQNEQTPSLLFQRASPVRLMMSCRIVDTVSRLGTSSGWSLKKEKT